MHSSGAGTAALRPPAHRARGLPAPRTSFCWMYSSRRATSSAFLPATAWPRFFSSSLSLTTVRPATQSLPAMVAGGGAGRWELHPLARCANLQHQARHKQGSRGCRRLQAGALRQWHRALCRGALGAPPGHCPSRPSSCMTLRRPVGRPRRKQQPLEHLPVRLVRSTPRWHLNGGWSACCV